MQPSSDYGATKGPAQEAFNKLTRNWSAVDKTRWSSIFFSFVKKTFSKLGGGDKCLSLSMDQHQCGATFETRLPSIGCDDSYVFRYHLS